MKLEPPGDETRLFRSEENMKSEFLYAYISLFPIFLGGNGFLSLVDYLREHREEIVEAATKMNS